MRRVLTTVLAVALLLGLGALAVLALPNGSAPLAGAPAVSAAAPEFQDAPLATLKWSDVAVPLVVKIDGSDEGTANNADEVAAYIEASCTTACPGAVSQVARWRSDLQAWEIREVGSLFGGDNFVVNLGESLLTSADSTLTAPTLSWVGDVPAVGDIQYNVGANQWTSIMIPLDQSISGAPATADELAADIGPGVKNVAQWREDIQGWEIREVGSLFGGENFAVRLGYPYLVDSTAAYTYPQ